MTIFSKRDTFKKSPNGLSPGEGIGNIYSDVKWYCSPIRLPSVLKQRPNLKTAISFTWAASLALRITGTKIV